MLAATEWTFGFPELNASLNALSGLLIVIAFVLVKQKKYAAHAVTMICASAVSAVFLACYLTYHYLHGEKSTHLHAHDWLRFVYFLVLLPHLTLAAIVLPMIVMTLWRASHRRWESHRRIAIPTFWIWAYVSSTGVIVYYMLYHTRLAT